MSDLKFYWYFVLGKLKKQFFRAYPENLEDYKRSRSLLIIYDICVAGLTAMAHGTFLVLLMTELGMSDGNMGLILSFYNFANIAQLISIKVSGKIIKNKMFVFHFEISRILLGVLYFIPFLFVSGKAKVTIFVVMYCLVQICVYICSPAFVDWSASLVPEEIRGKYYATKQAASNVTSLAVAFVAGIVADMLKAEHLDLLFVILGASVMAFGIGAVTSLLFVKEPKTSYIDAEGHEVVGSLVKKRKLADGKIENVSIIKAFKEAIKSSGFRKLLVVTCLWWTGFNASISFNTSFMLKELNLSYTVISFSSIVIGVIQAYLGPRLGKKADKSGTAKVTSILFYILALHSVFMALATPQNGLVMFILSRICYAITFSFIYVGLLNLKLEYIPTGRRIVLLSILEMISGVFGYAMSFVFGRFIDWFQAYALTKDSFIGYAQQYTNALSALIFIIVAIYLQVAFKNKKGNE